MDYTLIAIVVVIAIVIAVIINLLKKKQYSKIIIAIQSKDHETFKSLLEDKLTKFLFPSVLLESLRLNEAMMRNNSVEVEKILDKFLKAKLPTKDKEKIYVQAYNYYLSLRDTVKCKFWHSKIMDLKNDRLKLEIDKSYNIYIEKGYKYLDEMLDELELYEPSKRAVNEFLISLMYENMNNKEKAKEYKKLSEKHMTELDKEISSKQKNK